MLFKDAGQFFHWWTVAALVGMWLTQVACLLFWLNALACSCLNRTKGWWWYTSKMSTTNSSLFQPWAMERSWRQQLKYCPVLFPLPYRRFVVVDMFNVHHIFLFHSHVASPRSLAIGEIFYWREDSIGERCYGRKVLLGKGSTGERCYWRKILLGKGSIGERCYWRNILLEKGSIRSEAYLAPRSCIGTLVGFWSKVVLFLGVNLLYWRPCGPNQDLLLGGFFDALVMFWGMWCIVAQARLQRVFNFFSPCVLFSTNRLNTNHLGKFQNQGPNQKNFVERLGS